LKYLPSKKIIVVLVIPIAIGIIFVTGKNIWGTRGVIFDRGITTSSGIAAGEPDSDGDGLPDWEEALWKTDPRNTDSDRDGTPDGEEVTVKRDPTKPGPDDVFPSPDAMLQTKQSSPIQYSEQTAGGQVVSKFITNYLTAQDSGDITPEEEQEMIIAAANNMAENYPLPKQYMVDNIIVAGETDARSIKEYGNKLGEVFLVFLAKYPENEIAIMKSIASSKDAAQAQILSRKKSGYRDLVNDLLAMHIPKPAANIHLGFVNSYSGIYTAMDNIDKIASDPMRAAIGLKEYEVFAQKLQPISLEIQNLFINTGVDFTLEENGYTFLHKKQ